MIVVIGAGLIGLCAAYELAKRGAEVRVVEAGDSAEAPSWSAAGRLAPFTGTEGGEEEEEFLATALGVYQIFVKELHKRTGVDPYLRIDGIVEVAHDEQTFARLRDRAEALIGRGIHAHWFEADEARRIEPSLGPATVGATLIEDEGQIDNRRLGEALRLACVDAGVQLEERTGPVALETDGRRVTGVRSGPSFVPAEIVINATGPWAGRLAGVPDAVEVPIAPVKGQIVTMEVPHGLVVRLVAVPGAYLIPRPFDDTLVIGEIVDETAGFDTTVDPRATERLRSAAVRAMPALAEFDVTGAWAGLRARTPNRRPYIGATALDGYVVAAGHERNAILLAPATALAIANIVEGKAETATQ